MSKATAATAEATEMVRSAAATAGITDAEPETDLMSSKNEMGAPDAEAYSVWVHLLADQPTDSETISEIAHQWETEYGFSPTREGDPGEVVLRKGDRRAVVGSSTAEFGDRARTWIEVETELFDPEAARKATSGS